MKIGMQSPHTESLDFKQSKLQESYHFESVLTPRWFELHRQRERFELLPTCWWPKWPERWRKMPKLTMVGLINESKNMAGRKFRNIWSAQGTIKS